MTNLTVGGDFASPVPSQPVDWRSGGPLPAKAQAGYAPGLDGLRAIAVMIVLVAHFGFSNIIPGGFGVTVFFFISGFLITRLLIAERESSGQISIKKFYARRALRLLPALFVFLALSVALLAPMHLSPAPGELFSAIFYLNNYYSIGNTYLGWESNMPWGHLWSLAVEEHFYLAYPLVFAFIPNRPRIIGFISVLLAGCLVWRLIAIFGLHLPFDYAYKASDARLDSIGWGCLLALMLDSAGKKAWLRHLIGFWPTAFAAALLLAAFALRDDHFRETIRYTMQGAALFVGVLNLFFWRPLSPAIGMLDIAPLRFIGRLSYSLYLWHMPLADVWTLPLRDNPPMLLAVGLAGSLALACASYFLVERPLLGIRRKLGSHARA